LANDRGQKIEKESQSGDEKMKRDPGLSCKGDQCDNKEQIKPVNKGPCADMRNTHRPQGDSTAIKPEKKIDVVQESGGGRANRQVFPRSTGMS
jgi:hypothetical protein